MFTISSKYGIGQVEKIENGMVTVYFEDEDVTKTLAQAFTKIYDTYEAADLALNPEMTQEDADAIMAGIAEEKRIMSEGAKAQRWIEEHNIEASKRLMRNI